MLKFKHPQHLIANSIYFVMELSVFKNSGDGICIQLIHV